MFSARPGFVLNRLRAAAWVGLVALLAVLGCNSRADISGTVTYKGKTVKLGTVQIEGKDGGHQAVRIKDGTFLVRDIAPGEIKVAVISPDPTSGDAVSPRMLNNPKAQEKIAKRRAMWFPIPEDYQNLAKPKLFYEVQRGPNSIEVELK